MDETSVTSGRRGRDGAAPGAGLAHAGEGPVDGGDPGEPDGRAVRAERTRTAVVDALLDLNERGNLRPTARDIAAEAGVSTRTLYVHFDDLDSLIVAASDRQRERLAAVLPPIVGEGTFEERLDGFVTRRTVLHESGKGVRQAAILQEPFSPAMHDVLAAAREALRAEVRYCFRPELERAGDTAGELLSALDAAASSAAWEALRRHQGLDVDEARAQLRRMLHAFVAAWAPGSVGARAATRRGEGPPG